MKRRFTTLLALVLALSAFATPGAFADDEPTANLVETAIAANADGDFDILIGALTFATENGVDLIGTLSSGSFAVYAPTDKAFIDLARSIDPSANEDTAFGIIAGALDATYDGDVLGGLVDVLTYHVASFDGGRYLRGTTEMVNGDDTRIYRRWMKDATRNWVRISAGPIDATNGYISVIDEVLLPEAFNPTLLDVAVEANSGGDFDILIGALDFATKNGPVDFFAALADRDANLAVFAPTDDAFIALAGGVAEADVLGTLIPVLTEVYGDPVTGLVDVLTYHVAATERRAFGSTEMLNGENTRVYWRWVRDATGQWTRVVDGPLYAANGYLVAINKVLLPTAFR